MRKLTEAGQLFSGLMVEVFRLNGVSLSAGDALTAPVGLSSARWQVLGAVGEAPASVVNVARDMGLTRQGVQQTADALETQGFIEFLDNPHHRRSKLISLTAKGRKAMSAVEARHVQWANGFGNRLDPRRLKAALETLQEVRTLLEESKETSR